MSCVIRDGVYGVIRHLKTSPSNDEEADLKTLCSSGDEISHYTGDITSRRSLLKRTSNAPSL